MGRRRSVLVVGAGPSGLSLAIVLAQRGLDVRIIDIAAAPAAESRAAVVHVRTLELWDRLGVAERAVAEGVRITRVEVVERGRRLGVVPLGVGSTPFPFALGLGQDRTERLLAERLAEHGVRVERSTELVAVSTEADGVRARVRAAGVEREVAARWVVGADGAHSAVRQAAGLGFAGSTYPQTGLLADVRFAGGGAGPRDRIRLHLTAGGFVGTLPLDGGRHRLFGAVPPDLVPADHAQHIDIGREQLQQWLDERFDASARIDHVAWTGLFRVHSRITERFRRGPVFLVGDAAHLHSPAGGQGMNLAVGDAVNLGWKLAAVATGEAHERLLDSYEAERRPVAQRVLRGADRGFALETTANPVAVWTRAHLAGRVMPAVLRLPPVRAAVAGMFAQTWIRYRDSPVVSGRAATRHDPQPGDRVAVGRGGDLRHRALLLDGTDEHRRAVQAVIDRYAVDIPVQRLTTGRGGCRLLVLRPDGHLGYAGPADDLAALAAHLDRCHLRPPPSRTKVW